LLNQIAGGEGVQGDEHRYYFQIMLVYYTSKL